MGREELIKMYWVGGNGHKPDFKSLSVKKFKCKICFEVFDWKNDAMQHTCIHTVHQPFIPAIKQDKK